MPRPSRVLWLVAASFALTVAGAEPERTVAIEPSSLLLGSGTRAYVAVTTSQPLSAAVSTGTLSPTPFAEGDSVQQFQYQPPDSRAPTMALLLFWHELPGAAPHVSVVLLPLRGRTDLEVKTEPGAAVEVELAHAHFGPVKANPRGKAAVPIEVGPGDRQVKVLAATGRQRTTRLVPLDLPPSNPLVAAFSTEHLAAVSGGWLMVGSASPDDLARVEVHLTGGLAGPPLEVAHARLYRVTPAPDTQRVVAQVAITGVPGARATAEAPVDLPHPPAVTTPTPPPRRPSARARYEPLLAVGAFYSGVPALGYAVTAGLGLPLALLTERLSVDVTVSLQGFGVHSEGLLGSLDSSVLSLPVRGTLRFRVLEPGVWRAYVLAGIGVLPFERTTLSAFQAPFSEQGVGYDALLAAQLGYQLAAVEVLAQVQGSVGPLPTAKFTTSGGGLSMGLGVRCLLR